MERLQKVMAQAGVASRRQSEVWISSGYVKVNGQVVTSLGYKVDPNRDRIEVHGEEIGAENKRTFLFYKPVRVISSVNDPQGREVVVDYFRDIPLRLYPVGRLDYLTEGLLLVTNDGELAYRMMHPKYEMKKYYIVTVRGMPTPGELQKLREGIELDDGITSPADVRVLSTGAHRTQIELVIHEGRNRQVRRMFEALKYPVQHLIRTRIGFLTSAGLKKGMFRELKSGEIRKLKQEGSL